MLSTTTSKPTVQSQNHLFTLCHSHLNHGFVPHSLAQERRSFLIFYFRLRHEGSVWKTTWRAHGVTHFPFFADSFITTSPERGGRRSRVCWFTSNSANNAVCFGVLLTCLAGIGSSLLGVTETGMEAPTLESGCCVEHPRGTTKDDLFVQTEEHNNNTSTELETKQNATEATTCRLQSSSTSSHLSPLCSTHQSRFHSQESNSPAMHHGDVPFGKVVVPRFLWDKKTRERNKEPDLIEANVSWAPWAYGCLEGRTTEGGSDSCAAEISIERGRCGGDFYLETARCHKRELGDEARRGQAGSKRDGAQRSRQVFLRRAHFLGSGGKEGEIDILARSGTWLADLLCVAHFCKGNVKSLSA